MEALTIMQARGKGRVVGAVDGQRTLPERKLMGPATGAQDRCTQSCDGENPQEHLLSFNHLCDVNVLYCNRR